MGTVERRTLPPRRPQITTEVDFTNPDTGDVLRIHVSAGFDQFGNVSECFLRGWGRTGSMLDFFLDDAAVLLSLILQIGFTPETIAKHMGSPEQEPKTPILAALRKLAEIQKEVTG